jgi:hypothetical protein
MKYAAEMGSGAMKYIPNFVQNGSVKIKSSVKVKGGGTQRHTRTQQRTHKRTLVFFQNKESRLKNKPTSGTGLNSKDIKVDLEEIGSGLV